MERYKEIPSYASWRTVEKINKGWSEDEKYCIETLVGTKMLLRISDSRKFEAKRREFEVVSQLSEIPGVMSRTIDYGDPWEEFNRIVFCVDRSPLFASGMINGYFEDEVPEKFFRLRALYIANNQLAAIPWGIAYSEAESEKMIRLAKAVIEWYDGFQTYIPTWYVAKV